jgi:hypothetical protein
MDIIPNIIYGRARIKNGVLAGGKKKCFTHLRNFFIYSSKKIKGLGNINITRPILTPILKSYFSIAPAFIQFFTAANSSEFNWPG